MEDVAEERLVAVGGGDFKTETRCVPIDRRSALALVGDHTPSLDEAHQPRATPRTDAVEEEIHEGLCLLSIRGRAYEKAYIRHVRRQAPGCRSISVSELIGGRRSEPPRSLTDRLPSYRRGLPQPKEVRHAR